MNIPKELLYTSSHEWVRFDGDTKAQVGLTDYAQEKLGDLVFVNLPEPEELFKAGEVFADVESVKAVSDVYAPVTGRVQQVNEELLDAPEQVNAAPYESWFAVFAEITDREDLMDAAAYEAYCQAEE